MKVTLLELSSFFISLIKDEALISRSLTTFASKIKFSFMTIRTFCIKTHRFLGAILSLLFVLWFFSAFVLIYCSFPKHKGSEKTLHSPLLSKEVLAQAKDLSALAKTFQTSYPKAKITRLTLQSDLRMGEHYTINSRGAGTHYYNAKLEEIKKNQSVNIAYFKQVGKLWNKEILSIDTLNSLDQWTPFSRLRKDLPFYRLKLSGEDKQEVYISSRNGRIITEHTRAERIGAYFGAIPHWVYFTFIKQNPDLWTWTIIILASLGTFMVLTGIYIGIDMMMLAGRKKKKPELSPYRKKTYRWHHILGTFFGVFILAWIFSGLMFVTDSPDWLIGERDLRGNKIRKAMVFDSQSYKSEVQEQIFQQFPEGIRSIVWTSHFGIPTLSLTNQAGKEEIYRFDKEKYKKFELAEGEVRAMIEQAYGKAIRYELSKLRAYDGYYNFRTKQANDFVWKAEIDTEGSPAVYFNNASASLRIIDKKTRLNQWLFKKPHTLSFKWLKQHPWLWTIVMWTLLLMGLIISLTGFLMSIPYFRRLFKRKKKK